MPVEDNITPLDDNITPVDDNIMPVDDNITPVDDNVMPTAGALSTDLQGTLSGFLPIAAYR